MTQYSLAKNSSDYLSGKPDSRTGLFAKQLAIGKLKGNYLAGPEFKLSLAFNPNQDFTNYLTPFGSGWGLSIPAFIRSTDYGDGHLSLASGKSFYISEMNDAEVTLDGYLLKDIQLNYDQTNMVLTATEKSGTVSTYMAIPGDQSSGNLYLSTLTANNGLSLNFTYDNSQFSTDDGTMLVCLTDVTDDAGIVLAHIDYTSTAGNGTVVTLQQDEDLVREFRFMQENNSLMGITGPENYEADFSYYYNGGDGGIPMFLLSTVSDSNGLYEQVTYSTPATGGITTPGGSNIQTTVLEYRKAGDLTDSDSDYVATYTFEPGANQYNYLGNPVIVNADERIDSLLHYDGEFNYTSKMTETVIWKDPADKSTPITVNKVTTSTYNKFHSLLQKEEYYYSDDNPAFYDGKHLYTETITYDVTDGDISQQKATYALPLTHIKQWSHGDDTTSETEQFAWDDYANPTSHTSTSGIRTDRTYYPASGDTGCPADPFGFVRYLQTKIVTPGAPTSDDASLPVAPVRQYDYTYVLCPGLNDSSSVCRSTMNLSEDAGNTWVLKKSWNWDLFNLGGLDILHLESQSMVMPSEETTTRTMGYSLVESGSRLRTTIQTTGYDGLSVRQCLDRSIATGKKMFTADITVSETTPVISAQYKYDARGRLKTQTACPGSPFEATQSYIYNDSPLGVSRSEDGKGLSGLRLVPVANASTVFINNHGVGFQTVSNSDGSSLSQSQQDADKIISSDAEKYWLNSEINYDGLGNQVSATSYDWFPGDDEETPSIKATTVTLYDVWGESYMTIAPDGHMEIEQHDPLVRVTYSSLITTDGKEINKQQTTEDNAGRIIKTETLNSDGSVYSTVTTDYDGLSRTVRSTDELNQKTVTTYDEFDRQAKVQRPDDSVVTPTWTPFSPQKLMESITVQADSSDDADQYTYGSRKFDGLYRVENMKIGGRETVYTYDPDNASLSKPKYVQTPAGDTLTYTYQQELNESVLTVTSDASGMEAALAYTYDNSTGELLTANSTISAQDYVNYTYTYNSSGTLLSNELSYPGNTEGESESRTKTNTWSLAGKLLTTVDAGSLVHVMSYDPIGRQSGYTLTTDPDNLNATISSVIYSYDPAGRQYLTTTTDTSTGNIQTTTVTWYDVSGLEYTRTLEVSGTTSCIQEQTLDWFLNSQMKTRTVTRNGEPLRTESYEYTPLGQLHNYTCTGDYPDSPDGYKLCGQNFVMDFIGNIQTVTSYLLDQNDNAITNIATYTPDSPDRSRLKSITNDTISDWNIIFQYDSNSNMTVDDQNRLLTYNSRNQLMSITDVQGEPLGYFGYDAHGKQVSEQSVSDETTTMLYYQSGRLLNEMQGSTSSTYIGSSACVGFDNNELMFVELLGADQQGSIIQTVDDEDVNWTVYDPYGYSK
ncbi:hypothetical protein DP804_23180 [Salmonella enterica subsp. enterica]|nr:hypothetical protein [Salmonella enterica subsp. enterica serovar Virchow]